MKVKNTSARPHHVGDVFIAPGQEATVSDAYAGALSADLVVTEAPAKPAAAPKAASKGNAPAPAVQATAVQPAPVWAPSLSDAA
jgi:hypothetical protein